MVTGIFSSATPKWHDAELPLWSAVVPSFPVHPQVSPRWAVSTEDEVIGVSTQAKGDYFSGRRWGFAPGFKVCEQSLLLRKGCDALLSCWGKEGCPGPRRLWWWASGLCLHHGTAKANQCDAEPRFGAHCVYGRLLWDVTVQKAVWLWVALTSRALQCSLRRGAVHFVCAPLSARWGLWPHDALLLLAEPPRGLWTSGIPEITAARSSLVWFSRKYWFRWSAELTQLSCLQLCLALCLDLDLILTFLFMCCHQQENSSMVSRGLLCWTGCLKLSEDDW